MTAEPMNPAPPVINMRMDNVRFETSGDHLISLTSIINYSISSKSRAGPALAAAPGPNRRSFHRFNRVLKDRSSNDA
jgi:hypothetical protein